MRFLKHNSLSIFFGLIFLASLAGQALVGHEAYNEEQTAHARLMNEAPEKVSLGHYVTSSEYGSAVMENWQSEYLQFALFVLATIWFVQRGSPESKELHRAGRESDEDQKLAEHAEEGSPLWARAGGLRTFLYSNSLLIVMALIFLGSWFAQSVTGWTEHNAERFDHHQGSLTWLGYVTSATFWESTLQNWQSEFLAVGSMAVLSIYLRQRGSPESKPVGAPHGATGVGG